MIALIFVILAFLFNTSLVGAVSVTIPGVLPAITDQTFTVSVSVSGASANTTNYLEVDLFPTGTSNYFGFTSNGTSFIKNGSPSNCSQYYPIPIDSSGNWSGSVPAQLDTSSSSFTGSGNYSLKVRRYTSSCGYIWSNEAIIPISYSVSSPTPSATPTPTPSPTQTSSSSSSAPQSSFTIDNTPSNLNSDQSFDVSIAMFLPSNPNSQFYLKGAFIKDGSTNYFGQTSVSGSWVKNSSSFSSQFPVNTDASGNYSGTMTVMPDSSDSGFVGSGNYAFKVARYTTAGDLSWSNPQTVSINAVTPVDTDPAPTTSPSPWITSPTPSPTWSAKSLTLNLPSPKIDYSQEKLKLSSVAGIATSSASSSAKISSSKPSSSKGNIFISAITSILGLASLVYIKLRR